MYYEISGVNIYVIYEGIYYIRCKKFCVKCVG